MRVITRLLVRRLLGPLILGLAAIGAVALPASALAQGGGSYGPGHVYVDGNNAGPNTIVAFDRHADGTLTPAPGSPFAAGGTGLGKGLGSQGAVQLAEHGRYLLAVDAGSSQVSVLRVGYDGSLTPVGSPVSSDGVKPVSIAVHGDLVYVANDGNATNSANYTGFVLTRFGQLAPLPNSTVNAPRAANDLGDVLFNGDGTKLVGTEVASSLIDSFTVGWDGRLTAAPGSPFPAQGVGPFGSQFRPTNPDQLFVTNAHNDVAAGTTGHGTVSAFNDLPNGTLDPIGSSPFADLQTGPCWVVINPNGQYLYAVNTGSGTLSRYAIAGNGSLTLLGSTTISNLSGVGANDAGITANGRYLYVNESAAHSVASFAVNGGQVTELATSPTPVPAGITAAAGIAVN